LIYLCNTEGWTFTFVTLFSVIVWEDGYDVNLFIVFSYSLRNFLKYTYRAVFVYYTDMWL